MAAVNTPAHRAHLALLTADAVSEADWATANAALAADDLPTLEALVLRFTGAPVPDQITPLGEDGEETNWIVRHGARIITGAGTDCAEETLYHSTAEAIEEFDAMTAPDFGSHTP